MQDAAHGCSLPAPIIVCSCHLKTVVLKVFKSNQLLHTVPLSVIPSMLKVFRVGQRHGERFEHEALSEAGAAAADDERGLFSSRP